MVQMPDRRSVSVNGSGDVAATPDRARLALGVEISKPQLRDAQAEANRIVREYLAQARALGARDEDIATAGLSIRADYDYSRGNGRKFLGYHVSRSITVVVRDLDKIGDFLKKATDAGVNQISDPVLESSKADELKKQALAKAAEDARAKATVLAATLGAKLGAIHTLQANDEETPPRGPMPMVRSVAAPAVSANEDMGFAAGEVHYKATVSAEFDLSP